LSGWRRSSAAIVAGVAATLALTSCGGGARQDANEKAGIYHVNVSSSFPSSQRLAQASHFLVNVKNVGKQTIPDVAVTICNTSCSYAATKSTKPGGEGTSVQAFASQLQMQGLASDSRPVWIVDEAPNPKGQCAYSCQQGGPGGAVTAYSNTWALGPLKPGESTTFDWKVTAVKSGSYTVAWEVAAGLNGKARARTAGGQLPSGKYAVKIDNAPEQSYVNDAGQVVKTP
jgi:hypothetical protein